MPVLEGDFYGAVFDRCTDVEIDVLEYFLGEFEEASKIVPEEYLEAAKAKYLERLPPYIGWLKPYLEGLPAVGWIDFIEDISDPLEEIYEREEWAFEAHLEENCPPEQGLSYWWEKSCLDHQDPFWLETSRKYGFGPTAVEHHLDDIGYFRDDGDEE